MLIGIAVVLTICALFIGGCLWLSAEAYLD